MSTETEFLYTWDGYTKAEGLSPEGHEQIRLIVEAVQTKRRDIAWPARVLVKWQTRSMTPVGLPDEVGIGLSFVDDSPGSSRREIVRFDFRFPKAGVEGFSAEKHIASIIKN
jgi:hypothetical protein